MRSAFRLSVAWPRLAVASLIVLATGAGAEVRAQVDRATIDETESFRLVLQAAGVNLGEPDWTPLEADFDVGNKTSSTRISTVNGQVVSLSAWSITLQARATGKFTIPSITIGDEATNPIQVEVKPLDANTRTALQEAVFFETDVNSDRVYVQSEIHVTRRVLFSQFAQLINEMPEPPALDGAVVVPIGETTSFKTTRDGDAFDVVEQRFAVFAEHSGTLTIPGAEVLASVRLPGGRRRIPLRVKAEPETIEILPIPAEYPADAPWFPASRVTLRQDWIPEDRMLDVGDSIAWTLTVEGYGSFGAAIPPLSLTVPSSTKMYPDPPVLRDRTRSEQALGSRQETHTLIPTLAEDVVVPEVVLPWWNTRENRVEYARLGAQRLQVSAAPGVAQAPQAPEAPPQPEPGIEALRAIPDRPSSSSTEGPAVNPWMAGIAVLGWLLAGYLLVANRRRAPDAAPSDAGTAGAKAPDIETLRKRLGGVRTDAEAVKRTTFDWLQQALETGRAQAVRAFSSDPQGQTILDGLNRVRYARDTDAHDAGDAADIEAIVAVAQRITQPYMADTSVLPPLFHRQATASS